MKRRALFLDRDGVINEDTGFVGSVERFVFMRGVIDFLRAAQDKGYRLIVVTNQSGVARGKYSQSDYEKVTAHMTSALAASGVTLDAAFACFEIEKGGLPPFDRASFWRKPNAGMILSAALSCGIDLSRSAMLGDSERDLEAAQSAGLPVRLLFSPEGKETKAGTATVRSFAEALAAL